MILALLIVAAVVLSLVVAPRRKPRASQPQAPPRDERDVERLRDRYLEGTLTLEEFEGRVANVLEGRPSAEGYTEHWVIHIHDAPPGHSLHIHLP